MTAAGNRRATSVGPALLAFLCLVAQGCSLDVPFSQGRPSLLSVVNAAPAAASVAMFLSASSDPLVSDLSYREQTIGCASVFPTTQQITFVQGSALLASASASFHEGTDYTAVIANVGTTYRALALPDNQEIAAGKNGLRFINASATAGDVYVTPVSAAPDASYKVVASLSPLATSTDVPAYYQRPESDTRVRLYDVGSTASPRADFTITAVQPSRRTTIVFTDPTGDPGDVGAFQIHPCS